MGKVNTKFMKLFEKKVQVRLNEGTQILLKTKNKL